MIPVMPLITLALAPHVEGFGIYVPEPEEPVRAMPCPDYPKAAECRAAGGRWTKAEAECSDWPLRNKNKGMPVPPTLPAVTLSPSPVPTPKPSGKPFVKPTFRPTYEAGFGFPDGGGPYDYAPPDNDPTDEPSAEPTVGPTAAPSPLPTEPPTPLPTIPETTTTTKAEEVDVASTAAPDEEASTSTTAAQTTTTTMTAEQTTTTTTCFIPKAATYGPSGCTVETCDAGSKPVGNGSACEDCGVENATSYSSGCDVSTCDSGFKPSENQTACCAVVNNATTYDSDCKVLSCEPDYALSEAKDACEFLCNVDADCSGLTPACAESNRCVECTADDNCDTVCNKAEGRCVACTSDMHCGAGATPACAESNRCVECTSDIHCLQERECQLDNTCLSDQCTSASDCLELFSAPLTCDKGLCTECMSDTDCVYDAPLPACGFPNGPNDGQCFQCWPPKAGPHEHCAEGEDCLHGTCLTLG